MDLSESYAVVKKSVVAFAPKYMPPSQDPRSGLPFPSILGTGFVIGTEGLIVTNEHVVSAFGKLPRPKGATKSDFPVVTLLFCPQQDGMVVIGVEVLLATRIRRKKTPRYGPRIPDLALVVVKARDLPALEIDYTQPGEGVEVATAGFPMGTDALMAPGWLHQVTPMLQRGIVSALLPFDCGVPHGFAINVMVQGGASGSPVFLPESGKVIGVLYGGLTDISPGAGEEKQGTPTNISYVVPSHFIGVILRKVRESPLAALPEDALSLDELIEKRRPLTWEQKKKE